PVGPQPAEALLDGRRDPTGAGTTGVGVTRCGDAELGRDHDVVAPALKGLPEQLLGATPSLRVVRAGVVAPVLVGGVDEVDAGGGGCVQVAGRGGGVAPRAELVAPHADNRSRQLADFAVLHRRTLTPVVDADLAGCCLAAARPVHGGTRRGGYHA